MSLAAILDREQFLCMKVINIWCVFFYLRKRWWPCLPLTVNAGRGSPAGDSRKVRYC